MGYYIATLGPMYVLHGYMGPAGNHGSFAKQRLQNGYDTLPQPLHKTHRNMGFPKLGVPIIRIIVF